MLSNKKVYLLNYSKIILIISMVLILQGCSNKYYLKKRIDIFKPLPQEQFTITNYKQDQYSDIVVNKLKEKLSNIPLLYSPSSYATYLVHFNYETRYFWFPTFRITVLKQSKNTAKSDEVVYDAKIYAYNTNKIKSLAASLKIATDDLVNMEHPKNNYIKITPESLYKNSNKVVKKSLQKPQKKASPAKEHLKYRLYDNKELYKK